MDNGVQVDVKIARLEEQMKALSSKVDSILRELEQLNKMQVMIDRNNRDMPRMRDEIAALQQAQTQSEQRLSNLKGFVVGAGAAFGMIGGLIVYIIRSMLERL